jgi:hypothetical protein
MGLSEEKKKIKQKATSLKISAGDLAGAVV